MAKRSAGILPYRRSTNELQVLLVHPGGPFWQSRDLGAWSIAKGEYGDDEQAE
ncbi:MAG: NUDIX hydrolase, partial [Mesorhizobium sp.]